MTILNEGCLCCPFFLSSALVTQSSYSSGLILRFAWNASILIVFWLGISLIIVLVGWVVGGWATVVTSWFFSEGSVVSVVMVGIVCD